MKNIPTLLKATLVALLFSCPLSLVAQEFCTFSYWGSQAPDTQDLFPESQRSAPILGDFNNDGFLDAYFGGQKGDHWQPEEDRWKSLSYLVLNNGDKTFTTIEGAESGIPANTRAVYLCWDYNNDGNLDLLISGITGDDNTPIFALLKNLGPDQGYRFQQVENPGFRIANNQRRLTKNMSAGDYDKDGLIDLIVQTEDGDGRYVDLYKNNGDDTFTLQPANFLPFSSGAVAFADMDNDGWLDVISNGYCNSEPNVDVRVYRNKQDGTFEDITSAGMIGKGAYEGEIKLVDLTGDGFLDAIIIGFGPNGVRLSTVWHNNGEGGLDLVLDTEESGLAPVNGVTANFVDLNHDGVIDMVYTGKHDALARRVWICYQDMLGNFSLDESFPVIAIGADGATALGDMNNDGVIDIFIAGKASDESLASDPRTCTSIARVYENTTADITNTPPTVPGNLSAEIVDGILQVSWSASEDDVTPVDAISYNVMVKNNTTGKTFMLIPANPATGQLKALCDLQVATRLTNYSMALNPEQSYTVGVQAIDQGYGASAFATMNVGLSTAMNNTLAPSVEIRNTDQGIIVNSNSDMDVIVTDVLGRSVATGKTNTTIAVDKGKILLVTVGANTYKVAR